MKSITKQINNHKKLSELITPDYSSYFYHKEIMEYLTLCYMDAEQMRNHAEKYNQGGPSKQHSTSDFIVRGFLDENNKAKHYEVKKIGEKINIKVTPNQPSSDFSMIKNQFNLVVMEDGDPFRLERLFSVIEGNAAFAIKYHRDNPKKGWNPYLYPKECFQYHKTRPNSSKFIKNSSRLRIAISAFFAIHYLRSQLTKTLFEQEISNNINSKNFGYRLLEKSYFAGESYPEFVEFLIPFAIHQMSLRTFRWCHHDEHIILPEKNLISAIKHSKENFEFLEEEGYHVPLGPKFSVFLSLPNKSPYYHDLIIYATPDITDQALRRSIELFSYELLLNPTKKAKFLTHMESTLSVNQKENKLYVAGGKALSSNASVEEMKREVRKMQKLMPMIPNIRRIEPRRA